MEAGKGSKSVPRLRIFSGYVSGHLFPLQTPKTPIEGMATVVGRAR